MPISSLEYHRIMMSYRDMTDEERKEMIDAHNKVLSEFDPNKVQKGDNVIWGFDRETGEEVAVRPCTPLPLVGFYMHQNFMKEFGGEATFDDNGYQIKKSCEESQDKKE